MLITAIDAYYIEKSGKKLNELAMFCNDKTGVRECGIELSSISVIDLQANIAYNLNARQILDHPESRFWYYTHCHLTFANITSTQVCTIYRLLFTSFGPLLFPAIVFKVSLPACGFAVDLRHQVLLLVFSAKTNNRIITIRISCGSFQQILIF